MKIPAGKRLREIVDLIAQNSYVSSRELAEKYGVSMETIRKDLLLLEEKGILSKEFGGALLALSDTEREIEFRNTNLDAKSEIARAVMELLHGKKSMFLDSGSTCSVCCRYINLLPKMDIFTNSLDACFLLNGESHNVFFTGGRKREKNHAMLGDWTLTMISSVKTDICLLGTAGLLSAEGPTSHSYQELSVKKAMISNSDLVYVLADSSKFREKGLHTVCGWDKIDGIITDHSISPEAYSHFSKTVTVIVAQEGYENEENC